MKYIREYTIAVLLVAVFLLVASEFKHRKEGDSYGRTEAILKARYDSITVLRNEYAAQYLEVATELAKAKSAIQAQTLLNEHLKTRYNALKSMAPRNLTDSAINAEISRLYPVR